MNYKPSFFEIQVEWGFYQDTNCASTLGMYFGTCQWPTQAFQSGLCDKTRAIKTGHIVQEKTQLGKLFCIQ